MTSLHHRALINRHVWSFSHVCKYASRYGYAIKRARAFPLKLNGIDQARDRLARLAVQIDLLARISVARYARLVSPAIPLPALVRRMNDLLAYLSRSLPMALSPGSGALCFTGGRYRSFYHALLLPFARALPGGARMQISLQIPAFEPLSPPPFSPLLLSSNPSCLFSLFFLSYSSRRIQG